MNTGLYLLSELIQRPDGPFEGAPVLNHEQTGYHPAEQLYETEDGWIAVAARDEAMARRLVEVLRIDRTVTSPRRTWGSEVATSIATATRTRGQAELLEALSRAEVWAEACNPSGETDNLRDADLRRLGAVAPTQHPQFGAVHQIGRLVRFAGSTTPPSARHAPLPGEHTEELLTELGFQPDAIRDLRERKIVK
jgi:crotonobetainyl-CoA:carnitine CoA-transferase CaiB-like acyl-CoA transferase